MSCPTRTTAERRDGDAPCDAATTVGAPRADTEYAAPAAHVVQWNAHKAGLDAADAAHVQATVERMSRGSRFYANEERKRAHLERRVRALQRHAAVHRAQPREARAAALCRLDADVTRSLLRGARARDAGRVVVHVDMDQFFAAVALREQPELRGKPYAVGGLSMISTSSYEARKYGVRSGMPGFIGRELCPHLVFVRPQFARYAEFSALVHEALRAYDENCAMASLDEAYLDLTPTLRARNVDVGASGAATEWRATALLGDGGDGGDGVDSRVAAAVADSTGIDDDSNNAAAAAAAAAAAGPAPAGTDERSDDTAAAGVLDVLREVRAAVHHATGGLTCSAGAACNALLAKVATDFNKPDGQTFIAPNAVAVHRFLHGLPVRKVPGIGRVTERILRALDITTCDGIVRERLLLSRLFKEKTFMFLLRVGLGVDCGSEDDGDNGDDSDDDDGGAGSGATRSSRRRRKGISRERTFARGVSGTDALREKCNEICTLLWRDIEQRHLRGRSVGVKLKRSDFVNLSRATRLHAVVSSEAQLRAHAWALLRRELPIELRLLGVRVSSFHDECDTNDGGDDERSAGVHDQARLEHFWQQQRRDDREYASSSDDDNGAHADEADVMDARSDNDDVVDNNDENDERRVRYGGNDCDSVDDAGRGNSARRAPRAEPHTDSEAANKHEMVPLPQCDVPQRRCRRRHGGAPPPTSRGHCTKHRDEMLCPVCAAFRARYLSAMDAHVERCLQRSTDDVQSDGGCRATLHDERDDGGGGRGDARKAPRRQSRDWSVPAAAGQCDDGGDVARAAAAATLDRYLCK